jgi:ribosomal protein S20
MAKLKHGRHSADKKALRKSRKQETANKLVKDKIHFLARKIKESVEGKQADASAKFLNEMISACDKAAKHNIFHLNKASHMKARYMKMVKSAPK